MITRELYERSIVKRHHRGFVVRESDDISMSLFSTIDAVIFVFRNVQLLFPYLFIAKLTYIQIQSSFLDSYYLGSCKKNFHRNDHTFGQIFGPLELSPLLLDN